MKQLQNILLIDDNDADNDYHELIILRAEITHTIKTINSSIKALEYFKKCLAGESDKNYPLPDLIFIDLNMPALNGFELLDRVKLLPGYHSIKDKLKIYMLTGSLNPDDFSKATTAYSDIILGFRIKPLDDVIFREIASKL